MANARPPGGNTPTARIGIDLSSMQAAAGVARAAGQATAREINAMFQAVRTSQQLALQQARQASSTINAQNAQITAAARAESQVRIQQARAESIAQQQAARAAAQVTIQEERRKTAALNAEIRARARQASFGQGASQFAGAALGGIGGPVGGVLGGLAGGTPAIAAGLAVSAGARAAVDASQVAVAYNRQRVAALSLARSQARLNEMLEAYGRASGGAVDKATALSNVTRLQAVGFGDNAAEVERFTTAVRGSSIAMGRLQDEISQEVQLAISNQSFRRLDQIGLGITEVNNRIDELRAANAGMTREAAFEEAVLGLLIEKFGELAKSAEGAATGTELAGKAAKDARLEIGQLVSTPVNLGGTLLAAWIMAQTESLRGMERAAQDLYAALQRLAGVSVPTGMQQRFIESSVARDRGRHPGRSSSTGPTFNDDQVAALRRRDEGFADIERESTKARLDETRSYNRQAAQTVANYNKQVLREAQDFGRQRANAERKLQMSILDVAQDSARQRVKWEADMVRAIAEARAETDERIAELRADSAERVAEIEEDFAKDQEKRTRDHGKRLRDAAANLDAVAVREEQRRYREENQEAKEAHEEQVSDARESLQEAIDDQNKAFDKQEQQQRESLQRRIDEQKENDRLRIEEMKAAFEEQKIQDDIERGIRLERQAQDHNDQLVELERQHGERIQQIKDQAQAERDQWTEESNKFLEDVKIHNQAWLDEQKAINDGVIKLHEELLAAERRALQTPGHPSLADPYVDRTNPFASHTAPTTSASSFNNSRSTSFTGDINVSIIGGTNMSAGELRPLMYEVLYDVLDDIGQ